MAKSATLETAEYMCVRGTVLLAEPPRLGDCNVSEQAEAVRKEVLAFGGFGRPVQKKNAEENFFNKVLASFVACSPIGSSSVGL